MLQRSTFFQRASVKSKIHFFLENITDLELWPNEVMPMYDAGIMLKNQGIECFLFFL